MNSLPHEIVGAIYELLDTKEIALLRLVSNHYCQIASGFLMSEIHLILKPESFSRLVAISNHPIISQQITSILYEPDALNLLDRRTWEVSLPSRSQRTMKELDKGWMHYQRLCNIQQDLIHGGWATRQFREALTNLPKMRSFRMSIGEGFMIRSEYLRNSFREGLLQAYNHDPALLAGDLQLRSAMSSFYDAGIKLQVFECGEVSRMLFCCSEVDFKVYAETLSHVRTFKLLLNTEANDTGNEDVDYAPESSRDSKNGRLGDLISQANDLEHLDFRFDWWSVHDPIELSSLIGCHTWPRLTSVTLAMIKTGEEELLRFLCRHKRTLRKLHLDSISLNLGSWLSLVPQMRSSLHLKELRLEGTLTSKGQIFDLGYLEGAEYSPDDEVPISGRQKALEDWFQYGGYCPLTDEWAEIG